MQVALIAMLALTAECPCADAVDTSQPDVVALVEVLPSPGQRFRMEGRACFSRDAVVRHVHCGDVRPGQRIRIGMSFDWPGDYLSWIGERSELRPFGQTSLVFPPCRSDREKCSLPWDCAGRIYLVLLRHGDLIAWNAVDEPAPMPRPLGACEDRSSAEQGTTAVALVELVGARQASHISDELIVTYFQEAIVRRSYRGVVATGTRIRFRESPGESWRGPEWPPLPYALLRPFHRRDQVIEDRDARSRRGRSLPTGVTGNTFLVHLEDGDLVDWEPVRFDDDLLGEANAIVDGIATRLTNTPFSHGTTTDH